MTIGAVPIASESRQVGDISASSSSRRELRSSVSDNATKGRVTSGVAGVTHGEAEPPGTNTTSTGLSASASTNHFNANAVVVSRNSERVSARRAVSDAARWWWGHRARVCGVAAPAAVVARVTAGTNRTVDAGAGAVNTACCVGQGAVCQSGGSAWRRRNHTRVRRVVAPAAVVAGVPARSDGAIHARAGAIGSAGCISQRAV